MSKLSRTLSRLAAAEETSERYYLASQYQLMWIKLKKHRLALAGGVILLVFYTAALFCEFLSPYDPNTKNEDFVHASPQRVRLVGEDGFHLRPFVYDMILEVDAVTWRKVYKSDTGAVRPIRLFVRGDSYRMWGLFRTDVHLFGVSEGTLFLLGTDALGRDVFTRVIYGARISLTIGLIGVILSFVFGLVLGGVSGYFGGRVDMIIQRVIEFLRSIPVLPLWMALAAALPPHWPPLKVYFGITLILSVVGWTGLARVVRGKLLSLRGEDFVMAALISGSGHWRIIRAHLIPSFLSYVIVALTLAVPQMILAETALSFLGLGLRPPVVSWGVLLSDAQNIHTVALAPWLLVPGLLVILTVLAFNFVGDGLRDAADPYT